MSPDFGWRPKPSPAGHCSAIPCRAAQNSGARSLVSAAGRGFWGRRSAFGPALGALRAEICSRPRGRFPAPPSPQNGLSFPRPKNRARKDHAASAPSTAARSGSRPKAGSGSPGSAVPARSKGGRRAGETGGKRRKLSIRTDHHPPDFAQWIPSGDAILLINKAEPRASSIPRIFPPAMAGQRMIMFHKPSRKPVVSTPC